MARLTKIHANLIGTVLKNRSVKVRFSGNWQAIYVELEVGSPDESEKYLLFNATQLLQLNEMSRSYFGCDLLTTSFEGTRSEVAKHSRFEKLATIAPDEQYVLIKAPSFYPELPAEYSLRVPLNNITRLLASPDNIITHVVVVENLDIFDCWHQFSLDAELISALVVYRGHNGLAKGVSRLLERLPAGVEVIAFVDIDPAGIQIALTTPKVSKILAPEIDALTLLLTSSSASEDFDKQFQQVKYMQQHKNDWPRLQGFIVQQRASIKQQHLLAFNLPLITHHRGS